MAGSTIWKGTIHFAGTDLSKLLYRTMARNWERAFFFSSMRMRPGGRNWLGSSASLWRYAK